MGRKKLSIEHKKETTRIRNARNYAKIKEAREFYKQYLEKEKETNEEK